MTDPQDEPAPHRRRRRYAGRHPRQFADKYKELAPEAYPDIVAHIRERGRTPAGQHVPVLVEEVLDALAPRSGDRGVDATLGWGGHAERLLQRIGPDGQLLALDVDPIQLPRAEARLRRLGHTENTLIVRRTNFAGVHAAIEQAGWHDGVDFLFADLGVSSMQIDDPARGFSFKGNGPLDMRMNPQRGVPAARWLQNATYDELRAAFEESDEPHADAIARALADRRGECETAATLAASIRSVVPAADAGLALRRVFQALRIAVNDELGALDALLRQLPHCLRRGGRVAILTFHSGEDCRVKRAFVDGEQAGIYDSVPREVVRATPEERRANPRARPAKLRWARRA